eukprot:3472794-Amphidinium_carterae.1
MFGSPFWFTFGLTALTARHVPQERLVDMSMIESIVSSPRLSGSVPMIRLKSSFNLRDQRLYPHPKKARQVQSEQ